MVGPSKPERAHFRQQVAVDLLLAIGLDHPRHQLVLRIAARGVAHHALFLGQLPFEIERVLPVETRVLEGRRCLGRAFFGGLAHFSSSKPGGSPAAQGSGIMSFGRHSNEPFIAFQATMGPKMDRRRPSIRNRQDSVAYGPRYSGLMVRILTVSQRAPISALPERRFLRAGAGLAALAILLCAVTPADASLSRRMKFRAEQDAKRDTGPRSRPASFTS